MSLIEQAAPRTLRQADRLEGIRAQAIFSPKAKSPLFPRHTEVLESGGLKLISTRISTEDDGNRTPTKTNSVAFD